MAKKKKPLFRFRIPNWLSSESSAPRPPKDEAKSREKDDHTSVLIQEPQLKSPTQAQEVPIQYESKSHDDSHHQPEKTFSITVESPRPSMESTSSTLASSSSSPQEKESLIPKTTQPKDSPLKYISKPQEPPQQESPLKAILKSPPRMNQSETSSHETEPIMPKSEDSPLKSTNMSQEQTHLEASHHVSEFVPQPKEPVPQPQDSQLESIESQELTKPDTSSHVVSDQPMLTQMKEEPLLEVDNLESQEQTQLEASPHVSELEPQSKELPEDSQLESIESQDQTKPDTSSHISDQPMMQMKKESLLEEVDPKSQMEEPIQQIEKSPLKTISKPQEVTQPAETSSHVSEFVPQPKEPVPQLQDSQLKSIIESQELTKPDTSSAVSDQPMPQMKKKEEPLLEVDPKSQIEEPVQQIEKSPLKIISKPQEATPKTSSPSDKKFELDMEDGKSILKEQGEFHRQKEEDEKVVHEEELHTEEEASTSGKQTQEGWREKQDKEGSDEERKIIMHAAESNSNGKENIKVVSSIHAMIKNMSSKSHQVDNSSNRERTPLKKGIIQDISRFVQKLANAQPTLTDSTEEKESTVSAITLAGENRGATMQIGLESSVKDDGSDHHINPEGSSNLVESDEEVGEAYVNSNIQSINNSLMYHGSVSEKDPGVQLRLPQKLAKSGHSEDEDGKDSEGYTYQDHVMH